MSTATADADLKAFLRELYPSHGGLFPTDCAVRALALFTGASARAAERAVDARRSHHSLRRMRSYAARLAGLAEAPREASASPQRMTVLLPSREWAPGRESGGGGRSPSPIRPPEPARKICKQFRAAGKCSFGSRCLYHHAEPLGNVDMCTAGMKSLRIDSPAKETRKVLGALPSATNNYCSPAKPKGDTPQMQAYSGPILMLPLALPNGELYGYAPMPVELAQPFQGVNIPLN